MVENQYIRLWEELKKYFRLQIDYTRLTAVEKCSLLLSAIAVVLVFGLLCACALFYLSFALASVLELWVGAEWAAYLIVGGVFAVLLLVVYAFRNLLGTKGKRFTGKLKYFNYLIIGYKSVRTAINLWRSFKGKRR